MTTIKEMVSTSRDALACCVAMESRGDPQRAIDLEEFALIAARLAEGDRLRSVVLEAFSLTLERWQAIECEWSGRIARDAMSHPEAPLATAYQVAFTRAQDAIKPVPSFTPEEWARVVTQIARRGDAAREELGLSHADYMRLSRHWSRECAANKRVARAYLDEFCRLNAPARSPSMRP